MTAVFNLSFGVELDKFKAKLNNYQIFIIKNINIKVIFCYRYLPKENVSTKKFPNFRQEQKNSISI